MTPNKSVKKFKKTPAKANDETKQDNEDDSNEMSNVEMLNIINKYKKDSLNFILGDVNNHCNKSFRMPNDGWYPWTDMLIKSLSINKEVLKTLLKKDGHEKITEMCRKEGGFLWNDEDAFNEKDGYVTTKLNEKLEEIEKKLDKDFLTRWCTLKKKSAMQIISERLSILKPEISPEELKEFILDAKKKYFEHKKEKYSIINEYYNK